jgi:putative peptidoglycan lipid II flippase
MASFLATGSVSWLYYSDRLMEFPLGVFGIALATVILPRLSSHHAAASPIEYRHTLDWALRLVIVLGVPAAAGLFMLAGPLLAALFQYGEFLAHDARMATSSLQAYAIGLLAFILVKVLASAFYARQDVRTPVRIGVIAVLANIVLSLAFVVPMVSWGAPAPHAGLAFATTLAAFLNAGLLFRQVRRNDFYRPAPGWRSLLLQVGAATSAMLLTLWVLTDDPLHWTGQMWKGRVLHLLLFVTAGMSIYFASIRLFGLRWRHIVQPSEQV